MPTLPPAYDRPTGEVASTSFLELTDVSFIDYIGKGGQAIRINSGETGLEQFSLSSSVPSTIYVSSESDLPALNGSFEHPLAANTNYFFTGIMTLTNPLRIESTTTEMTGNGIGLSKVTYTGTGYGIRATNAAASVRMKFMQFIATLGDGIQFIGAGAGSGTNISLDRAYVIASAGKTIDMTSVDIFFQEASVVVGLTGLSASGINNGLFYSSASRYQSTGITTLIDFGTAIFEVITGSVTDFRGVAGTVALGGLPTGGNISVAGIWSASILSSGIVSFSGGLSSKEKTWKFSGNTGIPDSNTIAMGYITTPAATTVVDGSPTAIAGTWTAHSETERATVSAAGVITFLNSEESKGKINLTFSASKVSGGAQNYIFKVQKQALGVGGFVDVEAAEKPVELSATASSITILGIASFVDTDEFRMVIEGVGTDNPVNVVVTNFIVG